VEKAQQAEAEVVKRVEILESFRAKLIEESGRGDTEAKIQLAQSGNSPREEVSKVSLRYIFIVVLLLFVFK
jgi:hypothetical protein